MNTRLCFENVNLPLNENDYFHCINPKIDLPIPCVGDIVSFEDDSEFTERYGITDYTKKSTYEFEVVKRKFCFSRTGDETFLDDCFVVLYIKPIE